jgi:hypothetical protein
MNYMTMKAQIARKSELGVVLALAKVKPVAEV